MIISWRLVLRGAQILCALFLSTKKGTLECWVDILNPAEAGQFPADDVSLPPTAMFEVRVIIWKTKDVVAMDTLENMNDLFVRVNTGCGAGS